MTTETERVLRRRINELRIEIDEQIARKEGAQGRLTAINERIAKLRADRDKIRDDLGRLGYSEGPTVVEVA